jgi:hypothetical protein
MKNKFIKEIYKHNNNSIYYMIDKNNINNNFIYTSKNIKTRRIKTKTNAIKLILKYINK